MVDSQEVIERSFYSAILDVCVKLGYSLNPMDYGETQDERLKWKTDLENIKVKYGFFIEVIGSSNNYESGMKTVPKIVIAPQGFLPGNIGFEKSMVTESPTGFIVSEMPFETSDQMINVHIISANANQNRLLHNIMNTALPQRGYLKPYLYDKAPFDGNIFIQWVNFMNIPQTDKGLIEKVYVWEVKDTLLRVPRDAGFDVPITEIHMDIMDEEKVNRGSIDVSSN